MSYTVAQLIYGIPLLEDMNLSLPLEDDLCFPWKERSEKLIKLIENKNIKGLLTYYSGNANTTPFAFGIEIKQYEEDDDFYELKEEYSNITSELKDKFDNLFNALPDDLKKEIQRYGDARLCIIWATS